MAKAFLRVGVALLALSVQAWAQEEALPNDPRARMQRADKLSGERRYEEALTELLWCYDLGMKDNPTFFGVRVSFLVHQIAELGAVYPPARDALRARRDALQSDPEGPIPAGDPAVLDLASLNRELGDDERNLRLAERLRAERPDSKVISLPQVWGIDAMTGLQNLEIIAGDPFPEWADPQDRVWPKQPTPDFERRALAPVRGGILDGQKYRQRLRLTTRDDARLAILARRWDDVVLAVGAEFELGHSPFFRSVTYWTKGFLSSGSQTVLSEGDLVEPIHSTEGATTVLVKGHCRKDLTVADGSVVHVYGDLEANITLHGQCELVIGGDVKAGASIHTNGIGHVFVGGDVSGELVNKESSLFVILGGFDGIARAGEPKTTMRVAGDWGGTVVPTERAAMVCLEVGGFMDKKNLDAVAKHEFTSFSATVGASDVNPGLYPINGMRSGVLVVHSRRP